MDPLDLEALLAPSTWDPRRCRVAQALERIPDKDTRAKVAAACNNPLVPASNLHLALKGLIGDAPNVSTIRRHQGRTGNSDPCTCPKP